MDIEIIEALNNIAAHDWFDYINLAISILALISSAIFTYFNIKYVNENTNKQIENQNKETYRPRLRLKSIKDIFGVENEKILYANSFGFNEDKRSLYIYLQIELENIGYGIANDISFYMLNNGERCNEWQPEIKTENLQLDSTMEIPKGSSEIIKFGVHFDYNLIKEQTKDSDNHDTMVLICNYKDLNNNNYKILIGCILKRYEGAQMRFYHTDNRIESSFDLNFDYYYYQENTEEYNSMISMENVKDNYKKIIEEIK